MCGNSMNNKGGNKSQLTGKQEPNNLKSAWITGRQTYLHPSCCEFDLQSEKSIKSETTNIDAQLIIRLAHNILSLDTKIKEEGISSVITARS